MAGIVADPIGGETQVNTIPNSILEGPQITALADGGWVVTWMSFEQDGSQYGVYQQRYDSQGQTVGGETQVNTYTSNNQHRQQATALADGGWVVTWESFGQDGSDLGVYQQRYDSQGQTVGGETRVNTETTNFQGDHEATALAGGGWVVTWMSVDQDGSSYGIYQQQYDSQGQTVGSETLVNSYTDSFQFHPEITALADGGWIVAWESNEQDGSQYGVYQQRYDSLGQTVGGETRANTETVNHQSTPRITALADGGWVATWVSHGSQDGSGRGIFQQRYDSQGQTVGGETQVNTYTFSDQWRPQVIALEGGGWVVTWVSVNQDGSGDGIYQQQYDSQGQTVGGETQVSTETVGDQEYQRLIPLADGGWVVTWHGAGDAGVYQQQYDSQGQAVGGETLVNTHTSGNHYNQDVALLADGSWVVMWRGADTGTYRIDQQRFAQTNTAPVAPATNSVTVDEDSTGLPPVDIDASDANGDPLTYSVKSGTEPTKGSVTFDNVGGTFTYTPYANEFGSDSFTIVVDDGDGGTAEQVVSVTIDPQNDAPTAISLSNATVDENTAGALIGQLTTADIDLTREGDSHTYSIDAVRDDDGDSITAKLFVVRTNGKLRIKNGVALDFDTNESFEIDIISTDSGGLSVSETFTITILEDPNEVDVEDLFTPPDKKDATIVAKHGNANGTNGDDIIYGTKQSDTISTNGGENTVRALAGADIVNGGNKADIIFGESGADTLDGNGGNDYLSGAKGRDLIHGGSGRDTIVAGNGNDRVEAGDGRDVVDAGRGDDSVSGGGGKDYLIGGEDTGQIWSTPNNDFKIRLGDEIATGGAADTVEYSKGDGVDFLFDFREHGNDTLVFKGVDESWIDLIEVSTPYGPATGFAIDADGDGTYEGGVFFQQIRDTDQLQDMIDAGQVEFLF